MNTYKDMLDHVISALGGTGNINAVTHCATRLRFTLKDDEKAMMEPIESIPGVLGTQVSAGTHQVLIGPHVGDVYDELVRMPGIRGAGEVAESLEDAPASRGIRLTDRFTRMMSAVYAPYIPILATGGIASGVVGLLANLGAISTDDLTYQTFYAIFYALIYFFPIMLAYTAARHFRCNEYVAAALGASIMYPGVAELLVNGRTAALFGISFPAFNFAGSFVPILLSVFCMSFFERWLKRVVPTSVRFTVIPACCLFVFVPSTIMVFGPIGSIIANGISGTYVAMINFRILSSMLLGAFFSLIILFGLHWAITPIMLDLLAKQGREFGLAPAGMGNYAILGVCLAVLFLSRSADERQTVGSASFILALCGISEPCLYGVILKDKRLIVSMCLAGACGGLLCSLFNVAAVNFAYAGALSFGGWVSTVNFHGYVIALIASVAIGFASTICLLNMKRRSATQQRRGRL